MLSGHGRHRRRLLPSTLPALAEACRAPDSKGGEANETCAGCAEGGNVSRHEAGVKQIRGSSKHHTRSGECAVAICI